MVGDGVRDVRGFDRRHRRVPETGCRPRESELVLGDEQARRGDRNVERHWIAEPEGATHSHEIGGRQVLQREAGEDGVEASAHGFAERRAPAIALRIIDEVRRVDAAFAARIALARVGREARRFDERGPGDDLEHARRGRRRLDAQVSRGPLLDVARPRENAPASGVEHDDGGLGKLVLSQDARRRSLQVRIERQVRGPPRNGRCDDLVVVDRNLGDVDPRERGRGRGFRRRGALRCGRRGRGWHAILRLDGVGAVLHEGHEGGERRDGGNDGAPRTHVPPFT